MLITLSRSEAITHARYVFKTVALRAWDVAPEERDYIADLARDWDRRLAEVAAAAAASADELTEDDAVVLDRLAASATHPQLSPSAVVEWVDAFPEAIADLFAAALDVDAADDADVALGRATAMANKQPALALAA